MTALILLPGLDGTGDLFAPLLRELSDNLKPIVVRYPAREPLGYRELGRLVLETLPSNGPFVVLGESFSGPVAVAVAAEAPERFRGVVLCASFVSSPMPLAKILSRLVGVARYPLGCNNALASSVDGPIPVRRGAKPNVQRAGRGIGRSLARASKSGVIDVSAELADIDLPMLYLQAIEDAAIPKAAAAKFAELARRGRVEAIVGPHFLLQCAPSLAARAIERFVRGL